MNKIICAPSRIYEESPNKRFSYYEMAEYFKRVGIGAVDMSFENLTRFGDEWRSVLFGAARRMREMGLEIPVCHLSFYMPDPLDSVLMAKYSGELKRGIDAAALMNIPMAVAHPIAWYSSKCSYGDFIRANMAFLSPIVEYGKEKGVKICIENMASEKEAPENHLYGSCALNVSALAEKLGAGICWDVGHANISGYKNSEQMKILDGKIDVLHIHDNDGVRDAHLLPYSASVDWEDVAFGMRCCHFDGILDVEGTAWALPSDRKTRESFGKELVESAQRLIRAVEGKTERQ